MRICVEGNVCSGKSAVLEALRRLRPDVTVFSDDEMGGQGEMLERFRTAPSKWSLPLLLHMLTMYHEARGAYEQHLVCRSGPLTCRHVFGQLMVNDHKMTFDDWDTFKEYSDVLGWTPDMMVYIDAPLDKCYESAKALGIEVSLGHLEDIKHQYETMMRFSGVPVRRVDGLSAPEDIAQEISRLLD